MSSLTEYSDNTLTTPAPDLSQQKESSFEFNKRILFVTGRAGTGKSTLLRKLVNGTRKNVVVLAPTGAAAVDIKGQTIHSFFRFKPGITADEAYDLGLKTKVQIYKKLDILVIDEISMVRADLLDCIDAFLQAARKSDDPFGGVQAVFFGDVYQLEPVVTKDEVHALTMLYDSHYFFSSDVFKRVLNDPHEQLVEFIELKTIYRQSDVDFIRVLDSVRRKQITDEELEYINRQVDEYLDLERSESIYLTDTNNLAQRINAHNLNGLGDEEVAYIGRMFGQFNEKTLPTDSDLRLKRGARIMMLNNDPFKRWVNGSLGTVLELFEDGMRVELDDGTTHVVERYIWENIAFQFDPQSNRISKKVIGTYEQLPVRLAWAITIHKSQGKTFDKCIIILQGRTFAHGQMYVALSRCRTKEGLVLNRPITHEDIITDSRVKNFLAKLKMYVARWKLDKHTKRNIVEQANIEQLLLEIRYITMEDEEKEALLKQPVILDERGEQGKVSFLTGMDIHSSESLRIHLPAVIHVSLQQPSTELAK